MERTRLNLLADQKATKLATGQSEVLRSLPLLMWIHVPLSVHPNPIVIQPVYSWSQL
jgi:hypothetical protein